MLLGIVCGDTHTHTHRCYGFCLWREKETLLEKETEERERETERDITNINYKQGVVYLLSGGA